MATAHSVAFVLVAVWLLVMNRDIRQLRARLVELEETQQSPSHAQTVLSVIQWVVQIIIGFVAAAQAWAILRTLLGE